ncbi:MAG: PQQ-binding-like beta-propeller repeat protein [Myxococcota bacterium]
MLIAGCAADPLELEHDAGSTGGATGDASETGATGSDEGEVGEVGETPNTGGEATPNAEACLLGLAYTDALHGVSSGAIDCDDCDDLILESVLWDVEPMTGARDEFATSEHDEVFRTITAMPDGGFVVSGELAAHPVESSRMWRYSAAGALEWSVEVPGGTPYDVAVRGDEILAVNSNRDLLALSGADGAVLWDNTVGQGVPRHIEVDATGAIYTAGRITESGGRPIAPAVFVRKYEADGQVAWEAVESPPTDDGSLAPSGLVLDEAGGVIFGFSPVDLQADDLMESFRKYDAGGNEQWTVDYDADGDPAVPTLSTVTQMHPRPGGGFIAAGTSWTTRGATFVAAFTADGAESWTSLDAYGQYDNIQIPALTVAGTTVYASGCGQRPDGGDDSWLLVFDL